MAKTHRIFFALWPTAMLRDQLVARRETFNLDLSSQPVMPANLHVTLAFVGSVSEQQLPILIELGHKLKLSACELVFDRVAVWKQARVLVLEAPIVPPQLQDLVDELHRQLHAAGFKAEVHPYRPHVTLARNVRAACNESVSPLIWPAQDFVLVESLSTTDGVQYRLLATFAS